MRRNFQRAVKAYATKENPDRIGAFVTHSKTAMREAAYTPFLALTMIAALVHGILGRLYQLSIPAVATPSYQAAAGEMFRAKETYIGGTLLDIRMNEICTRWYSRGLSLTALTTIAYEVFGWQPILSGNFVLTTPPDHALGQALNGTLAWATSADADEYEVHLYEHNTTDLILATVAAPATSTPYTGLLTNKVYDWYVIARRGVFPKRCTLDFDFSTITV